MRVLILAVVLVCALLAASAIRRQRAERAKTVLHADSVPDMDDVHAALAEG